MNDPHGTETGVWQHKTTNTPNCEPCRQWRARYERNRLNDTIMGRPRLIPATGTIRKLCALQRLGWPMDHIAQRGGWKNRDSLLWMIRQSQFVTRNNAERIDHIYRELCMTPGPSAITRRRAERAGYMPPLAWDDIDNDPHPATGEKGDVDPVVVERILAGHNMPATRAERLEVIRRWVADGRPLRELAALTGWKIERYYKASEAAA
jgi:hypothetical protein